VTSALPPGTAPGQGGAGIKGADIAIINAGTIMGGAGGTGTGWPPVGGQAIEFTGGVNSLEIQAGSNIAGNVVAFSAADTFKLGGAVDSSFDLSEIGEKYQGFGFYEKTGAGTWTLTGTTAAVMPWTLTGGVLVVNGSIANSPVTVGNGAALAGTGTAGATTVQSGGTIAPGNSIGTLNVDGDYVQAAGAIYHAEVDPTSTASDQIAVMGTATLADGAVINVSKTTDAPYVIGNRYTVLTSDGGLTGTFDLTGDTDLSTFLGLTDVYDANNAYLEVRQTRSIASVAETPNQASVGRGLDSLAPAAPLMTALLNLPSEASARGALDQLSGEIHASAQTALQEGSQFARDAATGRMREALCAVGADPTIHKEGGHGKLDPRADGTPADCFSHSGRITAWGQGYGSWGHRDGNGNTDKLDRSYGGFFLGADVPIFDSWRVGVLAGYSRSSFDVKGRNSSGASDDYHLGLYGGTQWADLDFRTGVIYTGHDVSAGRSVALPGFADSLDTDYYAGTTQAFWDVGYRMDVGRAGFEPFANLAYVNLHTDSFTKRGRTVTLKSRSQDMDTTFTTLGLRASTGFTIGGVDVAAKGSTGWRHAFGDVTPVSTLSFVGGSAFDIVGVPIAKDTALANVGLDVRIGPHATLGISYNGQFAAHTVDQGVRGTLVVNF
jgi:outer membrane autotransporter protein